MDERVAEREYGEKIDLLQAGGEPQQAEGDRESECVGKTRLGLEVRMILL